MVSPFSKATGSTGDWDQSVVLLFVHCTLFLVPCSHVGFITSHSPFRAVAPLESALSLCSSYDFPLVFLLLSCLSVSVVLAWTYPFSSSCCSTVISFSWHLQPWVKLAFSKVPAAPVAMLECSGSVLTGPQRHCLKHRRIHLNIGKHFINVREMEHWHRLPGEWWSLHVCRYSGVI